MIITFCGHKTIYEKEKTAQNLLLQIDKLFSSAGKEKNILTFYCGGYGDFDMIAANTVNLLRKSYSDVKCENIFITPYITESYKLRNELMKKRFDCILYPPIENTPYRFAIIRRNEWMVKNSDLVLCHVTHSWGGAAKMLEFAIKYKKQIIAI